MAEKKAAIAPDKLGDTALNKITAADFLDALDTAGLGIDAVTTWPEKKKRELWTEPENLSKVKVKDIIDVIRADKKKVELEPWPGPLPRPLPVPMPNPWPEKKKVEREVDPRLSLQDVGFDDFVESVARVVEARLRNR